MMQNILDLLLIIIDFVIASLWPVVFLFLIMKIDAAFKEAIKKRPEISEIKVQVEALRQELDTLQLEMNSIKIERGIRSLK